MSVLATAMREEYLSLSGGGGGGGCGDGYKNANAVADNPAPVPVTNGLASSSVILDEEDPWNMEMFGGGGGGTA